MQRVKRTSAVAVLPADPAGGTPGYFAAPNPGGGVPATQPGYEWYNNIQEELVSVITAASIALDGTNRSQLLAALRAAGVFTTPAQFDNTSKAATTAFVNARGLAFGGQVLLSATGSLTAATHAGREVTINVSSITATLPAASTCPSGALIEILSNGASNTIQRAGSDVIGVGTGSSINSFLMGAGDTALLMSDGAGTWLMVGGSVQLGYSAAFGSSLASTGYQRLPSGLIVQWGNGTSNATIGNAQTITFPVGFTTAVYAVSLTPANASSSASSAWLDSNTVSNFAMRCNQSAINVMFLAVGK